LIAAVKKKETRGLGAPSQADRAFTAAEYTQVIDFIASGTYAVIDKRRNEAWMKFQLHLMPRTDDTSHVVKESLQRSTQFRDYLTVSLRWSKNVSEERDCPQQIQMGSMNTQYCVLVGLSLFLEKWIRDGDGATSQWLFCDGTTDEILNKNILLL
jgi:hypothetical protein